MKYHVRITREDPWWVAETQELHGAATESRSLADLVVEVKDLIGGLTDQDDGTIDVAWDFSAVLGASGQEAWDRYTTQREELDRLRRQVDDDRLATVRALHRAGVRNEDSAALVEVSHERIRELIAA